MEEKFVSFFHSDRRTYRKNLIFDVQKNKYDIQRNSMTEIPLFAQLKAYLKKNNIIINTFDISTSAPTYRDIYYDIPYPIPSNFSVWKKILKNKKKNIVILTEPPMINPFNYIKVLHKYFFKIYTWNESWVDNKKYFHLKMPKTQVGMNTKVKPFKKKKFLVLINTNKGPFFPFKILSSFGKELYSERINAIKFFENSIPERFSLYGRGWNKPKKYSLIERIFGFYKYKTYKGEVIDKIELLSNYKYSLCFENLTDVDGYITEKIFDCFKARCVPIYWGARNIEKYIPKNCFIDYSDFNDFKELLSFLDSIDEKKYNRYIENIEKFLKNEKYMKLWFEEGYIHFFLHDVLTEDKK